jgi:hypothetical protein
VDAADNTPGPLQHLGVVHFRRPTAVAREHRKTEAFECMQAAAFAQHGRHCGHFAFLQLLHECVLLQDLPVGPASGTVKLGHHGRTFLHADLVNTVLVRIQRQQAAIAKQADTGQGVEHPIGAQFKERMRHFAIVRARAYTVALQSNI